MKNNDTESENDELNLMSDDENINSDEPTESSTCANPKKVEKMDTSPDVTVNEENNMRMEDGECSDSVSNM